MPISDADVLSRQFFDLADKVTELSDSDAAKAVESFDEDDYVSVVATLLDAAYWVLASKLDDELDEQPIGQPLYVRSMVYNDLLYRGFDPMVAWEESGMAELFGDAGKVKLKKSARFGPGDYIAFQDDGGMRAGMLLAADKLFSFDGTVEPFEDDGKHGVKKLTADEAAEIRSKYGHALIDAVRRRVDAE